MNNYIVPNLSKACQILRLIASRGGISAVDIEKEVKMSRTTVFRILKTFTHEGFVQKNGTLFYVGAELLSLGAVALGSVNVREYAVPILQELAVATGETAHLAIPNGYQSLILEVCDSPNPARVTSRTGTLVSMHCSSTGKVFLANIFGDKIPDIINSLSLDKQTEHTLCTLEEIETENKKIRSLGYAIDDEEFHLGIRCLAAPVYDSRSQVVASIGITATTTSFPKEKIDQIAVIVKAAANKLSKSMGA
ncbi:MAG: IclR family transcriptional regulator [Phycisphaerae bacterium]|nr:IclR family transcriptional regulator [Phycisphaerae bacterium]